VANGHLSTVRVTQTVDALTVALSVNQFDLVLFTLGERQRAHELAVARAAARRAAANRAAARKAAAAAAARAAAAAKAAAAAEAAAAAKAAAAANAAAQQAAAAQPSATAQAAQATQAAPPVPVRAAPVPSGSPEQIAEQMLSQYGWSSGEFSCLEPLWAQESGWNVTAENPSTGAFGIPQAMPGSEMASAGPDWQTDAATQIRWGLTYIQERYGSPCGAWAHEQSDGWY
jgi:hypothetical protein